MGKSFWAWKLKEREPNNWESRKSCAADSMSVSNCLSWELLGTQVKGEDGGLGEREETK